MLKKIEKTIDIIPVEGVIYKNNDISLLSQTREIKRKAERKCKSIIEEARRDAVIINEAAYSEGYHEGFSKVIEDICNYMRASDEYYLNIRGQIFKDVANIISHVINKPEVIINDLNEWIEKIKVDNNKIHLNFPFYYERDEQFFLKEISNRWAGEIDIQYHDGKQVIIFCGSHIAEINPPEFIKNTIDKLSEKYDSEFKNKINEISLAHLKSVQERTLDQSSKNDENII